MILTEVLYVTPSSPRILMLDRFKDDDPELLARELAENYGDVIYFLTDLMISGTKEEDWPDIEWMNWYGKMVTSNLYACFHGGQHEIVEQMRFTEQEIKWFLNNHKSSILFVHEKETS